MRQADETPGRSQAGPDPLGGSADVPIGRGAPITPIFVTQPDLPPLEQFLPYLEQIWQN